MKKQEGTVMEKEKDVWSFKTSDLVTIPNIITYVRFVLINLFHHGYFKHSCKFFNKNFYNYKDNY